MHIKVRKCEQILFTIKNTSDIILLVGGIVKKEEILKIAKKKGCVLAKEVREKNINTSYLTKLVKEGKLIRVSRGYYILTDNVPDNFYIMLSKCKKAVFSHATALYLHNFSERCPLVYDITVPYGYGNCYKNSKNVTLHYQKLEIMNIGVIEMDSPFGMKIKVYDVERTICDIIKNKNKMDIEIFTQALKEYANSLSKDLNKLMRYAKKLKIENKVREYMEVIL